MSKAPDKSDKTLEAKDRVQQRLKADGFKTKKGEKAFDLIERYMDSVDTRISELEEAYGKMQMQLTASDEDANDLKEELKKMESNAGAHPISVHAIELLKESSTGFSDGLHYRSYCHRVSNLIERIEGPEIRL